MAKAYFFLEGGCYAIHTYHVVPSTTIGLSAKQEKTPKGTAATEQLYYVYVYVELLSLAYMSSKTTHI